MSVELVDIQKSQQCFNLNKITEKCLEFLNSVYDSALIREYNVSLMSNGYKMRRDGVNPPLIVKEQSLRDDIEKRFRDLHTQNEKKVKELTKQRQTEMVSVILILLFLSFLVKFTLD